MHITSVTRAALAAGLFSLVFSAPSISSTDKRAVDPNTPPTSGVVTSGLDPVTQESNATNPLTKRERGRIEVNWHFTFDRGNSLIASWYENGSESPSCSQTLPLPAGSRTDNSINGKAIVASTCDIYTIMDGPNPNDGDTSTYVSGHGVNCGWVSSPAHNSGAGGTIDYYFHCRY